MTDNPPPNGVIGVGRKLAIADLDKCGRNEIVVSSNAGLYIFYNRGTTPSQRFSKDPLPPNDTYPNNRPFGGRRGQPGEKGGRDPSLPGRN